MNFYEETLINSDAKYWLLLTMGSDAGTSGLYLWLGIELQLELLFVTVS